MVVYREDIRALTFEDSYQVITCIEDERQALQFLRDFNIVAQRGPNEYVVCALTGSTFLEFLLVCVELMPVFDCRLAVPFAFSWMLSGVLPRV